ncbi:MAG TPA: hypothetical protein VK569_04100, partial [Bacteroidota bacterium]|nr:hypothetical protein [Bacteroidota bacterium]
MTFGKTEGMDHPVKISAACAAVLICTALALQPQGHSQTPRREPHQALIAWQSGAAGEDSLDQLSLEAICRSVGLHPRRVSTKEIAGMTDRRGELFVLPHASAARMPEGAARQVLAYVEGGNVLVTDGVSTLARLLGISPGRPEDVKEVTDNVRPEVLSVWPGHQRVSWIKGYPKAGARIVYASRERGHPLALILERGRGVCLYIAPLVDPSTDKGYSRFSTLPSVIVRELGCRPLLTRRTADAYFDPGYRAGSNAEELARMWRSWGITGIHVAAWYASGTPPYDYGGLIQALHRNGILVYAWLEWPYVGKGFWDAHPSWRQKNALLQDAHLDFLYLMDLQNPACMAAALADLQHLLALDWDGVDVAEFTLTGAGREALEGPAMPEFFTGFTETGRREFSQQYGFDPIELFDPHSRHYWKTDSSALKTFYRYRTAVNYGTERALFRGILNRDREEKRSRESILTIVDNAVHPEFDDLLGFDMKETVAVTREFGLTLQVEDPYTEWCRPPDRYTAIGGYYRGLLGGRRFMIDVNVVPMEDDRKELFSTGQATGTEFLQLWQYASAAADRVCFYCESSVYENDWKILPSAMAWNADATTGPDSVAVDAPYTVTLRRGAETGGVSVDGNPWPALGDSGVILPAGKHVVRIDQAERVAGMRLVSLTGELTGAHWRGDSLSVEYQSPGRCALGFDSVPGTILSDGAPAH